MMNALKGIGLGVVIWSLVLLLSQASLALSLSALLGLMAALAAAAVITMVTRARAEEDGDLYRNPKEDPSRPLPVRIRFDE
jgi:hypothetical protein